MASTSKDNNYDFDCDEPLDDTAAFAKALASPPGSFEFTKFVNVLMREIKGFWKIQNNVLPITDPEKFNFFLIQVSCCLRELGCPYIGKIIDNMSSELGSNDGQLLLLDYLMFKLLTAKMIYENSPSSSTAYESGQGKIITPPTVRDLQDIVSHVEAFGLPANVNPDTYLTMLGSEIKIAIESERQTKLIRNTINEATRTNEWNQLEKSFLDIVKRYKAKRQDVLSQTKTTNPTQGKN